MSSITRHRARGSTARGGTARESGGGEGRHPAGDQAVPETLDDTALQQSAAHRLADTERELRTKLAELDRLNRLKSEFISIAAHELRTPMTSIVGYLDLISQGKMGVVPDAMIRPMASVKRNAERLRGLINDMLDISRLDRGRMSLEIEPCALPRIIEMVVEELRPFWQERRQDIRLSWDEKNLPLILADENRLHQVVTNLLSNAIKYSPEKGPIELRAALSAQPGSAMNWVELIVKDSGVGIQAELIDRIWEPFSDVNAAKHHSSGGPDSAGLGLHIAKGIVELHGGRIDVRSDLGVGTTFTLLLPAAVKGVKQPAAKRKT